MQLYQVLIIGIHCVRFKLLIWGKEYLAEIGQVLFLFTPSKIFARAEPGENFPFSTYFIVEIDFYTIL